MRYHHNPAVVVTDLQDELVLLDPNSKQMFSLNAVGRVLWLNISRVGLDATLEQITATFEVTPDRAKTDAIEMLKRLSEQGLLHPDLSSAELSGT
jgi:Coenzyme PQQ synthesis protein D (PqqD)